MWHSRRPNSVGKGPWRHPLPITSATSPRRSGDARTAVSDAIRSRIPSLGQASWVGALRWDGRGPAVFCHARLIGSISCLSRELDRRDAHTRRYLWMTGHLRHPPVSSDGCSSDPEQRSGQKHRRGLINQLRRRSDAMSQCSKRFVPPRRRHSPAGRGIRRRISDSRACQPTTSEAGAI